MIGKGLTIIKSVAKHPELVSRGFMFMRQHGIKETYNVLASYRGNEFYPYHQDGDLTSYSADLKFSILMPVYNVDIKWLGEAIDSVKRQNYTNWELCIVDDCSTDESVREYLSNLKDRKIKVLLSDKNEGISVTTNKAASMATGTFFLLMDNDDELSFDALDHFYRKIQQTDADIIYSDMDIVDVHGNHRDPLYKPDWSPDLFLSQMYIGHLVGFKKELFDTVGGFRTEYNGSQDYDLILRMTAVTNKVEHIAKILYSWRDIPSSTAANPQSKPYAQTAGLNAIQSYLDMKYGKDIAEVKETSNLFVYDVRFKCPDDVKAGIIIPTKDHVDLLSIAIDSIEELTEYSNYEIVVLNNNSTEPETFEYFKDVQNKYKNVTVYDANFEFNWSKLNNYGFSLYDADVYVCLNNDVKIINGDWLTRLVENAVRDDVGVVGGLLLYEDNTIQHAGVVVGMGGWAEHVYKGKEPVHYGSPYISPMVKRNVTAVTGACLAVSKKTLDKIGRFDERFIICGSDIELGIRASRRGLFNIYDPNVKLYHYESKTRDSYIPDVDFKLSYEAYDQYRKNGDPFYNSNLDYGVFYPKVRDDIQNELVATASNVETDVISADDVKVDEINPYKFVLQKSDRKRINLLVPSINPEHVFGGISTAIKFYKQLAETLGYDQRIILVDAIPSKKGLENFSDYKVVMPGTVSQARKQIVSYATRGEGGIPVSENDYFMFTGWWTAHCADEAYEVFKKETGISPNPYIYFIQDFEPGFYSWSTRYMLADATYRCDNDIIAVFNTQLLKDFFDKNGYSFRYSFVFEPVLNSGLKKQLDGMGTVLDKKKQILIYGRPNTERNAFKLVVAALNKWSGEYQNCSEWSIVSAGEKHDDIILKNGVKIESVGKVSIEEYAGLLAESYAGISLMVSPHPSYPPLEMATFGVKVITNTFVNKDLSSFSGNIVSLSKTNPSAISSALCQLCDNYNDKKTIDDINSDYIDKADVFSFVEDIKTLLDNEVNHD